MKTLERNQIPFAYAHAAEPEEILDEDGNRTGSFRQRWGEPQAARANISPSRGTVGIEAFGTSENYDRIICYTENDGIMLRELDAVWIDAGRDGAHDYMVVRVASSPCGRLAAVRRVEVSAT